MSKRYFILCLFIPMLFIGCQKVSPNLNFYHMEETKPPKKTLKQIKKDKKYKENIEALKELNYLLKHNLPSFVEVMQANRHFEKKEFNKALPYLDKAIKILAKQKQNRMYTLYETISETRTTMQLMRVICYINIDQAKKVIPDLIQLDNLGLDSGSFKLLLEDGSLQKSLRSHPTYKRLVRKYKKYLKKNHP